MQETLISCIHLVERAPTCFYLPEEKDETTLADPTIDGLFGGQDADRGKKQSQCPRCLIENYQLVTKQRHSDSPKKSRQKR